MEKPRVKIICGYKAIHLPDHHLALDAPHMFGWVYEHRVIAEEMLGRELRPGEDVHHLDEDKRNNRPSNLLVLDKSQHIKLHAWLRKFILVPISPNGWEKKECPNCLKPVEHYSVYCSPECSAIGRRKVERPSKEQLTEDIANLSLVKIGDKYKVSDNTVRKWAKRMGIPLPLTKSRI